VTLSAIADLAGFIGSALILATFARATLRNTAPDLAYNLGNLGGASLLAFSLSINFNLPALLLELAWAAIALFGLVRMIGRGA
jgi:hypothetical protein